MGSKRQRPLTFSEVVAESRGDTSGHPRDGQSSNRVAVDGAWDDNGRYWPAAPDCLSRDEVEALLDVPGIAVGVHEGYARPVKFFGPGEARSVWVAQLRDHFAEDGDLESGGWPDHVAYVGEIRLRPDGSKLLWFDGHC